MTGDTLGAFLANAGMRAFQVMVLRCGVATAADVGYLGEAGWGRPMSAVTRGAVRRSKILVVEQGMTMDTLLVEVELVGRNIVGSHQLLVGMTTGA